MSAFKSYIGHPAGSELLPRAVKESAVNRNLLLPFHGPKTGPHLNPHMGP